MLLRSQRCRRKAYRALRTTPVFVLALLLFLQFLQYSFSSNCHVNTIFLPGCSSRYSPEIVTSLPSGSVQSQRNWLPTRTSAIKLRVLTFSGPNHFFSWTGSVQAA